MAGGTQAFHASYGDAFAAFMARRSERHLRAAYELGREAVMSDLSVLDLAVAHHAALADALTDGGDAQAVTLAAGDFFLEALSAYEMVQRGFREALDAAALERRQADLLRQLSSFLADASLALGASDSLEEMLQLVAEQARELMRAETCLVTVDLEAGRRLQAASGVETGPEEGTWTWRPHTLIGGAAERFDDKPRKLSEALTALDGRPIGSIEVSSDDFTELDAAVLVQLAQMAAAAVERQRLYRKHGP